MPRDSLWILGRRTLGDSPEKTWIRKHFQSNIGPTQEVGCTARVRVIWLQADSCYIVCMEITVKIAEEVAAQARAREMRVEAYVAASTRRPEARCAVHIAPSR